jgi:hypothetical protein
MFLGVNPNYRNDLDIANVVATFGQFHYWNSNDPVKDRVLVYATFTSPQLVPRDVVFGKYASVGGIKKPRQPFCTYSLQTLLMLCQQMTMQFLLMEILTLSLGI